MTSIKTKLIVAMATGALLLNNVGMIGVTTTNAAEKPAISYSTHVQKEGWQEYVSDGQMSGTEGKALRLEGIKIKIEGDKNLGIKYSTHVQSIGWQDWKTNDEMSGTKGESKRLEAIKIELTGEDADKYDVYYRVHAQKFGWLGWAKNGAEAGTAGYAYRLEGIEIKIVEKGANAPGSTDNCFKEKPMSVSYRTHVQNIGWQSYVSDGKMAGTSGKAKRLEAINIKLNNQKLKGNIEYSTHVQGIGWQSFVKNNALSGTSGQGKRLEAIKIRLTDELAENYDIYYRVHAQKFGWLGWAKNGESAGTEGYAYRLEGIEIKLVEKGGSAPGSTDNAFKKKSNETTNIDKDTSNKDDSNKDNTEDKDKDTSVEIIKHDNYSYIKNNKIYFNGLPRNYGLPYNKEYTYRPDIAQEIVNEMNAFRNSINLDDIAIDNTMCVPMANCIANCRYQYDDMGGTGGDTYAVTRHILEANFIDDNGNKLVRTEYFDDNPGSDWSFRREFGFSETLDGFDENGEFIEDGAYPGVLTVRCNIPKSEYNAHEVLYNAKYALEVTSQTGNALSNYDQKYLDKVGISVIEGTDDQYWISIVYYAEDVCNANMYMDKYFY